MQQKAGKSYIKMSLYDYEKHFLYSGCIDYNFCDRFQRLFYNRIEKMSQ